MTAVAAATFHIQLTADTIMQLATGVGMLSEGISFVYGLLVKGVVRAGSVRR